MNCKRQKVRDEDKKFNFINLKSLLCINSFDFSFIFSIFYLQMAPLPIFPLLSLGDEQAEEKHN